MGQDRINGQLYVENDQGELMLFLVPVLIANSPGFL